MNKKTWIVIGAVVSVAVIVAFGSAVFLLTKVWNAWNRARHPNEALLKREFPAIKGMTGIYVCDPVADTKDKSVTGFSDGCAEWLQYAIGGDPRANRTPWWLAPDNVRAELGRTDMRLDIADAKRLANMLGVPYVAIGHVSGGGNDIELTYQVYMVPEGTPVGKPITTHGDEGAIAASLPDVATSIAKNIGMSSVNPMPRAERADDLALLARTRWLMAPVTAADILRLKTLAATDPLGAMDWLNRGGRRSADAFHDGANTLIRLAPNSAYTWSQICYVGTPYAEAQFPAIRSLAARWPNSYLLQDAAVRVARASAQKADEQVAAGRVAQISPTSPFALLTLAWTESSSANSVRDGRTYDQMTGAEAKSLAAPYQIAFLATRRATSLDPLNEHAWERLARAATASGVHDEADRAFRHAIALPGHGEDIYVWGYQMYQSKWGGGDSEMRDLEDLELADKQLTLPQKVHLLGALSPKNQPDLLKRITDKLFDEANARLLRNPKDAEAYGAKALIQFARNDDAGVAATLSSLEAAIPNDVAARNAIACKYEENHRWRLAMDLRTKILAIVPNYAYNLGCLGMDYKERGDLTKCAQYCEKAVALDPTVSVAHLYLARLAHLKKDYRTAADEYKKALDGGDDTEDCCDGLATTLDFLGDYAGSARYAEQAIAIDNADLDAWGPASDAYIHLHRYADALRACKMMLIIDPNNMLAHENMAETYLAEGKVDDAKPEWRIVAAQGEPFLQSVAQKYLAKYP